VPLVAQGPEEPREPAPVQAPVQVRVQARGREAARPVWLQAAAAVRPVAALARATGAPEQRIAGRVPPAQITDRVVPAPDRQARRMAPLNKDHLSVYGGRESQIADFLDVKAERSLR
jgi:hypothetical protein